MSVESAHTAWYVHCAGCDECEPVRVSIARWSHRPSMFPRWHAEACDVGRDLLAAWKIACDEALFIRLPIEGIA